MTRPSSFSWDLLFVYLLAPIFRSLRFILALLVRPIFYLVHILLVLPAIQVIRFSRAVVALPLALLLKFETILTYLAAACAVGIIAGCILYGTAAFLNRILGLGNTTKPAQPSSSSPPPMYKPHPRRQTWNASGRTIAEYRASRENKKIQQQQQNRLPAIQPIISPREFDAINNTTTKSATSLPAIEMPDSSNIMYMNGRDGNTWPQKRGPLSSQTILEEDDSDSTF